MNKILSYTLFFFLILGLSFLAKHYDLLTELIISMYFIYIIYYIVTKKYSRLQEFVVIILEICVLKYILGVTGLWLILIVFILPSLRKADTRKIWGFLTHLFKLYMRIIDNSAEIIYQKYVRKYVENKKLEEFRRKIKK